MRSSKKIVVVAGNIGAGKTALTERIGQRMKWDTGFESVADNPYLPDFYADMRTWSFHLQMYFLGHRAEQYKKLASSPTSVILDRSIYEDAHIFVRALHHLGNLTERDHDAYKRLYEVVLSGLPTPNLLIYLKAPVSTLMDRIKRRARGMETGIEEDYLTLLDSFYEDWLSSFDMCPVLTINTKNLDYVNRPEVLDQVADHIERKLAGKDVIDLG